MPLAEFVPAPSRKGRSVKACAVPVTFPRPGGVGATAAMPENRTAPVGWPAMRSAATRCPDDPVFRETARTGLEALRALEQLSREVALDLRERRADSARRGMLTLMLGVQAVVMLATTAVAARGDDPAHQSDAVAASQATERAVADLIAGQACQDWSALADGLERSLLPALRAWRMVFETFFPGPSDDADPHGWAA